jgi:hypothetical protein
VTGSKPFDTVFVKVGGVVVQLPLALDAQACALAPEEVRRTAQMRLDERGLMPSDVGHRDGHVLDRHRGGGRDRHRDRGSRRHPDHAH